VVSQLVGTQLSRISRVKWELQRNWLLLLGWPASASAVDGEVVFQTGCSLHMLSKRPVPLLSRGLLLQRVEVESFADKSLHPAMLADLMVAKLLVPRHVFVDSPLASPRLQGYAKPIGLFALL